MKKYPSRFSDIQMRRLGLRTDSRDLDYDMSKSVDYNVIEKIVKGEFKNIIDVLYSSKDGSLDNDLDRYISRDSVNPSVRSFVESVLKCNVSSLMSAPDDDTAFDMIIPRSAQTESELRPYLGYLKNQVRQHREQVLASRQGNQNNT